MAAGAGVPAVPRRCPRTLRHLQGPRRENTENPPKCKAVPGMGRNTEERSKLADQGGLTGRGSPGHIPGGPARHGPSPPSVLFSGLNFPPLFHFSAGLVLGPPRPPLRFGTLPPPGRRGQGGGQSAGSSERRRVLSQPLWRRIHVFRPHGVCGIAIRHMLSSCTAR